MGSAFLFDLAYTAGVAISPTPIVVVIAMLFSQRGRANALAFLIGWMVGLALLSVVLLTLVSASTSLLESSSIIARPLVQILLGIAVLVIGWRQWNKPPQSDAAQATPKWMSNFDNFLTKSSDHFTPARAVALAIFMSALSPKNIALLLAAIFAISQADLPPDQAAILLILFVLVSSVTIGIPVCYALIKGEQGQAGLDEWKNRLMHNRGRALALLLFVLGGIVVMNGLIELLQKSQQG